MEKYEYLNPTSNGNWAGPAPKLIFRVVCPFVYPLLLIVISQKYEMSASNKYIRRPLVISSFPIKVRFHR